MKKANLIDSKTQPQKNQPLPGIKKTAPARQRPLALELIRFDTCRSVIVSETDYDRCLPHFETMAGSDGARFVSQLGQCDLAFNLHTDSANMILIRGGQELLGMGRLVWSQPVVKEFKTFTKVLLPVLTGKQLKPSARQIPCLLIHLSEKFRDQAAPDQITLALNVFAGAGLGLLQRLTRSPGYTPFECSLELPSLPLFSTRRSTNQNRSAK